MGTEEKLKVLKGKFERIKTELGIKKGERQAVFNRLTKELDLKPDDDPYELLKDLSAQADLKEEKRDILLAKAEGILKGYV